MSGTAKRKPGRPAGESGKRNKRGQIVKVEATTKQLIYADALARQLQLGVQSVRAARAADYASPETYGHALPRSPAVRDLERRGQERVLDEAAVIAVETVPRIASGLERCDPTRWAVIQFLLKRAGLDEQDQKKTSDNKPLSAMTLEELEEYGARLQGAKTVASVPELPASAVQVIDNAQTSVPLKGDSGPAEPDDGEPPAD